MSDSEKNRVDTDKKFEDIYELIKLEYQNELERGHKFEEKAVRLFTILNIVFPLLASSVIKYDFWKELKGLNFFIIPILTFLIILVFLCLVSAWYDLFKIFRVRQIKRINLMKDNNLEDIVYCETQRPKHFHWQAYKDFQKSIEENEKDFNELAEFLKSAQSWLWCAFSLFFTFLFILFLCFFYKVLYE